MAGTTRVRTAITRIRREAWTAAIDADGGIRDGGHVAEITDLLDLTRWPPGMRVIIRWERPHPGAQLDLFEEADGWRYHAVASNTQVGQLAFLQGRPAPTPDWRTGSGTPKTPAAAGSRPASSPSSQA